MKTPLEVLDDKILDLTLQRVHPAQQLRQEDWESLQAQIDVLEGERRQLIGTTKPEIVAEQMVAAIEEKLLETVWQPL